jgi:hypothetical protein
VTGEFSHGEIHPFDALEQDDFSSNRHPAFWWSMIFSENRDPLFAIMP